MERPTMRRFVNCENDDIVLLQEEELLFSLENIELSFSQVDPPIGIFKFRITSKRMILLNSETAYDFDIPFIGLHAISRDPNGYRKPCIYCQLDQEEDETPDELYLVPETEDSLKDIFDVLSRAAEMNPDPPEYGEQEGDDELIFDANEVNLGVEQSRMLAHYDSIFIDPESQFQDAVEEEEEEVEEEDEPPKKKK